MIWYHTLFFRAGARTIAIFQKRPHTRHNIRYCIPDLLHLWYFIHNEVLGIRHVCVGDDMQQRFCGAASVGRVRRASLGGQGVKSRWQVQILGRLCVVAASPQHGTVEHAAVGGVGAEPLPDSR